MQKGYKREWREKNKGIRTDERQGKGERRTVREKGERKEKQWEVEENDQDEKEWRKGEGKEKTRENR